MTATTDTRLIDLFELSDEFLLLLHREGARTVSEALRLFDRRRRYYNPPSAASVLYEMTFFRAEWEACESAARAIREAQTSEPEPQK